MGKVSYSFDKEYYYGTYDTDEEAKMNALEEIRQTERKNPEEIPEEIYIGKCEFFRPSLSGTGWDVIDSVICQAEDEGFGEWCEDYLSDVTKEQREELEAGLEKVFQEWIEKYKLHAGFFKVNTYDLYEYDTDRKELRKAGKGIQE